MRHLFHHSPIQTRFEQSKNTKQKFIRHQSFVGPIRRQSQSSSSLQHLALTSSKISQRGKGISTLSHPSFTPLGNIKITPVHSHIRQFETKVIFNHPRCKEANTTICFYQHPVLSLPYTFGFSKQQQSIHTPTISTETKEIQTTQQSPSPLLGVKRMHAVTSFTNTLLHVSTSPH